MNKLIVLTLLVSIGYTYAGIIYNNDLPIGQVDVVTFAPAPAPVVAGQALLALNPIHNLVVNPVANSAGTFSNTQVQANADADVGNLNVPAAQQINLSGPRFPQINLQPAKFTNPPVISFSEGFNPSFVAVNPILPGVGPINSQGGNFQYNGN